MGTSATLTEILISVKVEFAVEQMNNLYELSDLNELIASRNTEKTRGKNNHTG